MDDKTIEVIQLPKGQFETLIANVAENQKWMKENKGLIDTSSEKHEEYDKRLADFDKILKDFREAQAGSRIWGGGSIGSKRQFSSPLEALNAKAFDDEVLREWQRKTDLIYLASVLSKTPNVTWVHEKLGNFKNSEFFKEWQAETKAMYEGGTGVGAEWVPTILSSDLFHEVRLALKVAPLHPHFSMTSNTVEIPSKSGAQFAELIGESTSDSSDKITAKTHGTRKITFNAKKFGLRTLTSTELDEDSIVPTLQAIREDIVYALSTAEEYAIINGDLAGTQDSTDQNGDLIHSKSNLKAWDGYRSIARDIGAIISAGSTLTANHALLAFQTMGKYAADPTQLAWVTGTKGMFKHFMGLGNVQTLDKLGPQAVLLNGQLGAYLGVPIIISEWIREDVGESGLSGGASGLTKTNIELVNKSAFRIGENRQIKIESEKDIDTDQIKIVGTRRESFKNMYTTAAANAVLADIKGLS